MSVKEESETAGLKLNIQKTKSMASGPITSWQPEGEKMEVVTDFLFLDCKTDSVMSDSLQPHHCAYQAPLSMEFPRQDYWRALSFPSPGNLPYPGLLHYRQILYRLSHQGSDCSHEVKRGFLPGKKARINLESILKSRDITFPTQVCIVIVMVFPVVMYRYKSWAIK